jgi:SAM-dependent methyltransferase
MFRYPVLSDSAYLRLYADGTDNEWSSDGGRNDLAVVRAIIAEKRGSPDVLDVGCGSGNFLLTLSVGSLNGVEPSVAASAAARKRGVSILAPTLDELPNDAVFDVITLIDVIEHVTDAGALLDAALRHLAPGGFLIVATGDAGYPLWRRVFRSRFWYSSFPEHITFPSLQYFRIWQNGKGLQAATREKVRYRRSPVWRAALRLASQALYLVSPLMLNCVGRFVERLRRTPNPRRRLFSPGGPGVFTDHQIITFRNSS